MCVGASNFALMLILIGLNGGRSGQQPDLDASESRLASLSLAAAPEIHPQRWKHGRLWLTVAVEMNHISGNSLN